MSLVGALVLAAALFTACAPEDHAPPSTGDVRVYLTDVPIDLNGVLAVNVRFSELALYPTESSDDDAVEVSLEPLQVSGDGTVNLLAYRDGQVVLLGIADQVPEGDYRRIRLAVSAAELVRDHDGDPATPEIVERIDVPAGRVDVPVRFTAVAGEGIDVTLDFDASASVHVHEIGTSEYELRPVVTPVGLTRR